MERYRVTFTVGVYANADNASEALRVALAKVEWAKADASLVWQGTLPDGEEVEDDD